VKWTLENFLNAFLTPFAHRDFDHHWLDFAGLGGYFLVPGILNLVRMAFFCSEIETAKLFESKVSSFHAEI